MRNYSSMDATHVIVVWSLRLLESVTMRSIFLIMTFVRTAMSTTQERKYSSRQLNSSVIVLSKVAGIDAARRSRDFRTEGSSSCIVVTVEALPGVLLGPVLHRPRVAVRVVAPAYNHLLHVLSPQQVHHQHLCRMIRLDTQLACHTLVHVPMDHLTGCMACRQ
mmetsp:Transcript_108627/g.312961  ORF Transcript_108627/g.312961 Transcript_108627/m.312961 type:complete len:163 (+) Transcript_108627:743-1231(+)